MTNPFKKAPIASLAAWGTAVLAVLVVLQANGLLTGRGADIINTAAGVLQVLLTVYARQHVTPVADPKDNLERPLVALQPGGPVR